MIKPNFTLFQLNWFFSLTLCVCFSAGFENLQAQCSPVTGIVFNPRCDGSADLSFTAGAGNIDWNISIDENGNPFAAIPHAGTTNLNIAGVTVGNGYNISVTGLCAGGGNASAAVLHVMALAAPVNPSYTITGVSSVAPTCPGGSDGSITFTINDPADVGCTSTYTFTGTAGGVPFGPVAAGVITVNGVSAGATTISSSISPLTCGICIVQNPNAINLIVPAGTDDPATFDVVEQFGGNVVVIQNAVNVANTTFNLASTDCVIDLLYNLTDIQDDDCNELKTNLIVTNITTGASALVSGPDGLGDWQIELGDLGPGTYTIQVVYSDSNLNTTTENFEVTINDVTGPTLNTGGANAITIDACDATMGVPMPDFTGNASDCSGIASVTQSPAAGTTTGIGTTIVTVTAIDNNGNATSETFDLTVAKGIDASPVVVLTGNSHVFIPPCETFVTVSYNLIVSDDCDNVTGIGLGNIVNWDGPNAPYGANSLSPNAVNFLIDVTEGVDQQLRASYTDASGNTSFADIFVTGWAAPPATGVACNGQVNVTLEPSSGLCQATITPDMVLEGGNGGCLDNYSVSIQDGNGTNNVLNGIGTFIYVVTGPNGFTCWGQINAEDKLPPEIVCSDVTIECDETANAFGQPGPVPDPVATDNCFSPVIQLQSETVVDDICALGTTTITRVYIASDAAGNVSVPCTQTITINRTTDVLFPVDVIVECSDFEANPSLIDPTSTGAGIPSNIDGHYCKYNYVYSDDTIPDCGTTFKIIRTWTVVDWCTNSLITSGSAGDNVQVVKVVDSTPPAVNIPPFEVSANNVGAHPLPCTSTGFLPVPVGAISDACHDFTVRIFTTVGEAVYPVGQSDGKLGGSIPYPGLEVGPHLITYVVEDVCGNIQVKNVSIEVVDDIPPTVVCDSHTQIAITNDGGCSTLSAESLDDGSYDNCNSVYFLMAKMDDAPFSDDIFFRCYYPTRDFCCEEAGSSVQVILLVLDGDPGIHFDVPPNNIGSLGCDGTPGLFLTPGFANVLNFNTCMVTVDVVDKLPPEITCPGPENISCDFYWENIEPELSLAANDEAKCAVLNTWFGDATASDNCGVELSCSFTNTVDQCGNGTIIRSWSAIDPSGNGPVSCSQTITVSHISDWVVEFPPDVILDCGTDSSTVQNAFGEPNFFNVSCELIATSYEDQAFTVVQDACFKVVRTWTILNWCVVGSEIADEVIENHEMDLGVDLDGDGDKDNRTFQDGLNIGNYPIPQPDGFITYQQVVKVIDTIAPALSCQNQDFCIDSGCSTDISLTPPVISDCVGEENVTITATSDLPNFDGNALTANTVPSGTYTVTFTAVDNCGNSNSCQIEVTVRDCKKPTPVCLSTLAIELMQTGTVDIVAKDFDPHANSFDNCSQVLKWSFSPDVTDTVRTFNCSQLGQQSIEMWVTDEANNQDFCLSILFIQDNMGACNPDNPLVQGVVANEANEGVQDVEVIINSPNGTDRSFQTETSGNYNFPSVPIGGDYTLTPIKNIEPRNGVTTFDLVLLSWHILGINLLDSPYKLIAADVNRSGSITTFDMVEIRKLILFINDRFPNNTSWRFVDKDFVFPDPANPFASPFPEVINLNNLTQDELFADFIAVKIGDVNGSATPSMLLGSEDRSGPHGELIFAANDMDVQPGETFTVDFTAKNFNVYGFQFTLNFDRSVLELVDLVPGLADESNFGLAFIDEGALTASWNSSQAKQLAPDEIVFSLTFKANALAKLSDVLKINSRYTIAEAYGEDGIQNVALEFNGLSSPNEFELNQNRPNPFSEKTVISFTLAQASGATLTISDLSGRVVKVVKENFSAGYNEIRVNRGELSASGVLYYQLETPTATAIKKMILIN